MKSLSARCGGRPTSAVLAADILNKSLIVYLIAVLMIDELRMGVACYLLSWVARFLPGRSSVVRTTSINH
jgi:hypothetical protein